jgi:hypothetical protein
VDYLRRRALVHFSSGFPTTLSEFDQIVFGARKMPWGPLSPDPITRIRAIQVAREVDAPWILPRAFYTLSLSLDRLGITIFTDAVYKGIDTRLSVQDQTSFLKGYNLQCQSTVVDALAFLSCPLDIQGCEHPWRCSRARLKAIPHISDRDLARGFLPNSVYMAVGRLGQAVVKVVPGMQNRAQGDPPKCTAGILEPASRNL